MCIGKIKGNCKKQYANCTAYEGTVPEFSELTGGCYSVEETTSDIYSILSNIKEDLNLESLRGDCITYPLEIKVLDAFQALQTFICQQQTVITTLQSAVNLLQTQVEALQDNPCN